MSGGPPWRRELRELEAWAKRLMTIRSLEKAREGTADEKQRQMKCLKRQSESGDGVRASGREAVVQDSEPDTTERETAVPSQGDKRLEGTERQNF